MWKQTSTADFMLFLWRILYEIPLNAAAYIKRGRIRNIAALIAGTAAGLLISIWYGLKDSLKNSRLL